jgi:hypothetical protein
MSPILKNTDRRIKGSTDKEEFPMAQIECGRGHLYDPDQYPTCPYCNTRQQITVAAAGRTAPLRVTAPNRTAPLSATPVTEEQRTQPPKGYTPVTADQKTQPPRGYMPVTAENKTQPPRSYDPAAVQSTAPPRVSVAQGGRTVGLMQEQMGFDPVVGWLACVEGPSRGKSYTIRGGVNSIGRGDRMDITITGDMKLSAENHAKLSYSERSNRFNLIPGDGRNIIYLNGEEVFVPTVLSAYDLIDFGETKLLFIPLCGERFTWGKEGGHGSDQ